MKHPTVQLFFLLHVILALTTFVGCDTGKEARKPVVQPVLTIEHLKLDGLELGAFVEEWASTGPLKVHKLDLTKVGAFTLRDSAGGLWLSNISVTDKITIDTAINDTTLRNPVLEGLKLNSVILRVKSADGKDSQVRQFTKVIIKDAEIRRLTMSRHSELDPNYQERQSTLAKAKQAKEQLKTAAQLRDDKMKKSPQDAARLLGPQLDNMATAVDSIIFFLEKKYKPTDAATVLPVFNLRLKQITTASAVMIGTLADLNTGVKPLLLIFQSGHFDIDMARNKAVLEGYLGEITADLNAQAAKGVKDLKANLIITAFADLQAIDDKALKETLTTKYGETCDNQECYNRLLSQARADEVLKWYKQEIAKKFPAASSIKVTVTAVAEGKGWELPNTYNGNCQKKDCEDRRIALISRAVTLR